MFFRGAHPVEFAAETGNEFDEVVNEFFLCRFVRLVFDDSDGDAVAVEIPFEIREAKAGKSIFVGNENAPVVGFLYVIKERVESTTVFVETTANIGVGVFDAPAVVVSVVCESLKLAVEVAVVFLAVA